MMKKLLISSVLLGALGISGSAMACSLAAWSASNGAPAAGGPGETTEIARFSGLCSMQTNAAADYVQDNSPAGAGEDRIIARFYFLAEGGTGTVFEGFSDEPAAGAAGTSLFNVSFDGTNVSFDTGNATLTAPANATGWNAVEIDWNAAGSEASLWVNADATSDAASDTGTAAGASADAVRLGGAGFLFDAYEARRSTNVGTLCVGDANGDAAVNVVDASLIIAERLGQNTASGNPDCNSDGTINVVDASCVVAIRLGATGGACS